jgi:hypothetical protein
MSGLERGNNRKKIIRIVLLFFKRKGKGVMCTATLTALIIFVLLRLRRGMLFLLTPFYSPSLIELERGNNSKKNYPHRSSLLKKRGEGGE